MLNQCKQNQVAQGNSEKEASKNSNTNEFFQALYPKIGNCENPHRSPPEKNHWKKAHRKLIEKNFAKPRTCFLRIQFPEISHFPN